MTDSNHPEFYADQFYLNFTVYGATLVFGTVPPIKNDSEREEWLNSSRAMDVKGTVHMSIEHLKAVALVLRHQLKKYELQVGKEVYLPENVYQLLGVSSDEW